MDLESGLSSPPKCVRALAGDTEDLPGRVMDAMKLEEEIHGRESVAGASQVKDITGDKGFYSPGELGIIQKTASLRTIIGDPNAARR